MKNANQIVRLLKTILANLKSAKLLSPTKRYQYWKQVEDLIDGRETIAKTVLASPFVIRNIDQFREQYGEFLYDLELQWSVKITSDGTAKLTAYPKFRHYQLRVSYEMHMLQVIRPESIRSVLLVGCGPLPLSALMIKKDFFANVDLLDRSAEALAEAKKLIRRFGRNMKCRIIHSDVLSHEKFKDYDVVFLAGTVGSNRQARQKIVEHIFSRMKLGGVLVLRPPINLEKLILADVNPREIKSAEVFLAEFDCREDTMRRVFLVRQKT